VVAASAIALAANRRNVFMILQVQCGHRGPPGAQDLGKFR